MASFTIHLAIAHEYMKNNSDRYGIEGKEGTDAERTEKDRRDFIEGSIDVDIYKNHNKDNLCDTHYVESRNLDTAYSDISGYMQDFVKGFDGLNDENRNKTDEIVDKIILTPYQEGVILHLLVDALFYKFLREKYNIKWEQDTFYNDYNALDPIILKEYGIEKPDKLKEFFQRKGIPQENHANQRPKVLRKEIIYEFIDTVSKINLKDYMKIFIGAKAKNYNQHNQQDELPR